MFLLEPVVYERHWADLFAWRNDDATRAASLTSEPIPLETHLKWLDKILRDPQVKIFIGRDDSISAKVGMGRLEQLKKGRIELALIVAPEYRGRGYAERIITQLVRKASAFGDKLTLVARVREENGRSLRAFVACGFTIEQLVKRTDGNVVELVRSGAAG